CEMVHVSLEGAHSQEPPPVPCPQTCPLGHLPPHAGAGEIAHVSSGVTHSQEFPPDASPQICPLGQVPPHAGACEIKHEYDAHGGQHIVTSTLQSFTSSKGAGYKYPRQTLPEPQSPSELHRT